MRTLYRLTVVLGILAQGPVLAGDEVQQLSVIPHNRAQDAGRDNVYSKYDLSFALPNLAAGSKVEVVYAQGYWGADKGHYSDRLQWTDYTGRSHSTPSGSGLTDLYHESGWIPMGVLKAESKNGNYDVTIPEIPVRQSVDETTRYIGQLNFVIRVTGPDGIQKLIRPEEGGFFAFSTFPEWPGTPFNSGNAYSIPVREYSYHMDAAAPEGYKSLVKNIETSNTLRKGELLAEKKMAIGKNIANVAQTSAFDQEEKTLLEKGKDWTKQREVFSNKVVKVAEVMASCPFGAFK
jgi:hypothetical protein